jgi:hypothetical protein
MVGDKQGSTASGWASGRNLVNYAAAHNPQVVPKNTKKTVALILSSDSFAGNKASQYYSLCNWILGNCNRDLETALWRTIHCPSQSRSFKLKSSAQKFPNTRSKDVNQRLQRFYNIIWNRKKHNAFCSQMDALSASRAFTEPSSMFKVPNSPSTEWHCRNWASAKTARIPRACLCNLRITWGYIRRDCVLCLHLLNTSTEKDRETMRWHKSHSQIVDETDGGPEGFRVSYLVFLKLEDGIWSPQALIFMSKGWPSPREGDTGSIQCCR